jgi:hypothetical protein
MSDEQERTEVEVINWSKPSKMLEITPDREVVFYSPTGLETWRCSFDDLSAALRQLLDRDGPYPPPNWPVDTPPKTKRDEPRARKVGER